MYAFMHIFYRFWAITIYWSKIYIFAVLPTPVSLPLWRSGKSLHYSAHCLSGPGSLLVYAGQLSAYSEINISGKHRGFDDVLFNLWPLANAGFRDAQY